MKKSRSSAAAENGSFFILSQIFIVSNHGHDIHNFEETGNIKWAPIPLNGNTQYVISTPSGFGTTTPPPDGKPVVNCKGQTAEYAEFEPNLFYDIPSTGVLSPRRVDNLLAAGRNLSSDVYAQSGARLIMCCFTMGESAGTACAISIQQNIPPRALDVKQLQHELLASGVNIGQKMRNIPGLSDDESAEPENLFENPEYSAKARIIRDSNNEFTRK